MSKLRALKMDIQPYFVIENISGKDLRLIRQGLKKLDSDEARELSELLGKLRDQEFERLGAMADPSHPSRVKS